LHKGAFLVLEGDTDSRVFEHFIEKNDCMIIPAHNKDNAVNALKFLEKDGFVGILVIVDADFWHIEGVKPDSTNLLPTDTHDLETMILSKSGVLERLLAEFGSDNVMQRLPNPVRLMLCESCLPVGFLRWLSSSSRENLPIRFRELFFENFVDKTKLKTDIDKLIEEAELRSRDLKINKKSIKAKIKSLKKEDYDPWQVCSGHDMIEILSIGLRSIFGNPKSRTITAKIVEGVLRIGYEYPDFCLTKLHTSIKEWEKKNLSFKILRDL
jgi:hypothetical protein